MKKTIGVLNRLVREKVIRDFSIGGAMGAMWYMEAVTTMDLDIFVLFVDETSRIPLAPVYAKLKDWGYLVDPNHPECVDIEGVPVLFLPVYGELLEEAMSASHGFDYEGEPVRVMTAEHLAAICVKTGRLKDKLRVAMFLQSTKFDRAGFLSILDKFGLRKVFEEWKIM